MVEETFGTAVAKLGSFEKGTEERRSSLVVEDCVKLIGEIGVVSWSLTFVTLEIVVVVAVESFLRLISSTVVNSE